MKQTEREPKLVPQWAMLWVLAAGMISLMVPGVIGQCFGAAAATIGIAYFVQSWRHAGWVARNR